MIMPAGGSLNYGDRLEAIFGNGHFGEYIYSGNAITVLIEQKVLIAYVNQSIGVVYVVTRGNQKYVSEILTVTIIP